MHQAQSKPRLQSVPAPMPAGHIRALGMDSATWQRHASPWSVYTRMATLPFLVAAVWSHSILGPWVSLGLTFAVMGWLWVNPRLFAPPKHTRSWAARATLGERIWLNRLNVPIPAETTRAAMTLSIVAGAGFLAALLGAYVNDPLVAVTGVIITYAGKLVFLQRMVLLYEAMRDAHPLYRFWSVSADNDNVS